MPDDSIPGGIGGVFGTVHEITGENVSHEFRAPPTLMLGPVGDAIANPADPPDAERRTAVRLAESQRRFQAIFENSLDAILLMDDAGRYVDANPAACQLLGYTRDELVRLGVADVTPGVHRDRIPELMSQFLAAGTQHGEYTLACKDGSTRDVEYPAITNVLSGLHLSVLQDVTERRRVELTLLASEARYRAIFDQADVGVAALDYWSLFSPNPGYCKMVDYSPEEIGRLTVADITHPDDLDVDLTLARRLVAGEIPSYSLDKRYVRKGGEVVWVTLTCSLIRKPSGEPDFIVGVVQDITDRKRAEAERERLHREVAAGRAELEVLSRRLIEAQEAERAHLARELHDEIGQVLTTVNLTLESVRARAGPAAADRIDESRRVVDRAIEQVRSLSLDLRPASLDLLGLEPALRAYLARQVADAGLALAFTSSLGGERLPPALETVCFRVVQEATTNVLRHARATRLEVELGRTEEEVRVTIRDDGVGFDVAAAWDRVLRGEGFGLAGMRERVQHFGGRIDIESAIGSGTTIVVHFPVGGGPNRGPSDARP